MAGGLADPLITPGRRLVPGRASDARPDPPLRGGGLLGPVETAIAAATNGVGRLLREDENPLARTGAVANTAFLIALATGIPLLFWYRASVGNAYDSLQDLSWFPQLLRSLHRYSSDVCLLFVLLHGLQTLAARKVAGARWLAWLSGVLLVGFLWLDGWTGYWMVWDERAQRVAVATARFLDLLPIFKDPIARSFLVDETVNTLLFFLVFFIHMLIPMGMGILLWLHILRLDRSKFFTGRVLTAWLVTTLVLVSVLVPARSADPAAMQVISGGMTGDHWYLGPLMAIERLPAGALWLALAFTTVIFFGIPWLLPKRRIVPSIVDGAKCNGCTQCWKDCPFGAISLMPADPKGRESALVASIDPSRCVGCGICVGSCDSTAIDNARQPVLEVRKWVNHAAAAGGGAPASCVAFVCGASAAAAVRFEADGSSPDLPGYQVLPVPCAGWVHMLTVERAIRHGAPGVLIVGCGHDSPCREGADWTAERLSGERPPGLRTDQVGPERVRYLRAGSGGVRAVALEAVAFRAGLGVGHAAPDGSTAARGAGDRVSAVPGARRGRAILVGASLAAILAAATWLGSDLPLPVTRLPESELVVSFKHAGQPLASTGTVDDSNVLPHMRRPRTVERGRNPVRMRVSVDGAVVLEKAFAPGGLFDDGNSIAVEHFPIAAGERVVTVEVGDGPESAGWGYALSDTLDFGPSLRRVILFEGTAGFTVY